MSSSLVGAVYSLHTDAEMVITVTEFAEHTLGRTVVRSQDRAGSVVNTLLIPYLLSAIRMAETRLRQTLRRRRRHGTGLRSSDGPVEARRPDRPGQVASIATSLYDEFKKPLYAPPPLIRSVVEAGLLGPRSGRGFRTYAPGRGAPGPPQG